MERGKIENRMYKTSNHNSVSSINKRTAYHKAFLAARSTAASISSVMVKCMPLVRPLLSEGSNRHFSSKRNNRDDSFSSLLPAAATSGLRKTKQASGLRSAGLSVGGTSFPMEMVFRPTATPKSGARAIGRIAHLMTLKMTVMAACSIVAKEIYSEGAFKRNRLFHGPNYKKTNYISKNFRLI